MALTDPTIRPAVVSICAMAACLLAFPPDATSQETNDSSPARSEGRCALPSGIDRGPLVPDTDGESRYSSCMEQSGQTHISFDVCLQGAGGPASVLPSLVDRFRAAPASSILLAVDRESGNPLAELDADAPRSVPVSEVPQVPNRSSSDSTCTADRSDQCRSLPPGPAHLNVEASPIPPTVRGSATETPERPDPDETPPRFVHTIDRSDGYDTPPDKPPRT